MSHGSHARCPVLGCLSLVCVCVVLTLFCPGRATQYPNNVVFCARIAVEFVAAAGTVVLVANARSAIVAAVFFRVAEAAVASRAHALREVDAHLFVHASKSPASEFLAALAPVVTFSSAGILPTRTNKTRDSPLEFQRISECT